MFKFEYHDERTVSDIQTFVQVTLRLGEVKKLAWRFRRAKEVTHTDIVECIKVEQADPNCEHTETILERCELSCHKFFRAIAVFF